MTYTCTVCGAAEPRALTVDPAVKAAETPRGIKHWTVGALIERDGQFLLLHKRQWPYLWDVIAGHLGVDESPEAAVKREVEEETGLRFTLPRLIFHGEIFPDPCRRGSNLHEWYLFRGTAGGNLHPDAREVRELRWMSLRDMVELPFVRPAYAIFDALHLWDKLIENHPTDQAVG